MNKKGYISKVIFLCIMLNMFFNSCIAKDIDLDTATNLNKLSESIIESKGINAWITGVTNISSNRAHLESAVINDNIYIFGGAVNSSNVNALNNLEMYNPTNNTWEEKSPMPTGRLNPGSVVFDNKIYCIGGLGANGRVGTLEVYSPETDSWETKAPMPTARDGFIAEVVDGYIYCIGGRTSSGVYTNSFEVYNIAENTWETKTPISTSKGFVSSVVLGDNIYCMGGTDGTALNTLEVYNTKTDTWATKASVPTPRYSGTASIVDNKIYFIGGRDTSYLDTVEVYDIASDSWETIDSMPTARAYGSSSVVNNKIYVFGGFDGVSYLDVVEVYVLVNKLNSTMNLDIYIKVKSNLSLSLDTNYITFEYFDGINDMIRENAINLTIESSLPYRIDASLETEIQNEDGTNILDKSILGIKSSSSDNYQTFTSIKTPVTLLDNQQSGVSNSHSIDFKINKDVPYKIDVYKTTIKFEVIQK